jgi:predicted SnoaL-like aldol condensation-catalyzing enzyme
MVEHFSFDFDAASSCQTTRSPPQLEEIPMNKSLFLAAAFALNAAASVADAQSPAKTAMTKSVAPIDVVAPDPAGVIAVAFLDLAFNQKKVDEAVAKYLAPPYTQHNPQIPDGVDGARAGIAGFVKQIPGPHFDVKRVIVGGDLVAVHSLITGMGERGTAVIDIFRVKNGKLVEHWDVLQAIPATAANDNTMF